MEDEMSPKTELAANTVLVRLPGDTRFYESGVSVMPPDAKEKPAFAIRLRIAMTYQEARGTAKLIEAGCPMSRMASVIDVSKL